MSQRVVVTIVLAGALALAVTAGINPPAQATSASTSVLITGHGWGHGRGMGQWGAVGYAVDHGWGWQQILDHYYGGTVLAADAGNPVVSVRLDALIGRETIVTSRAGTLGVSAAPGPVVTGGTSARVVRVGASLFDVYVGPSCGGPWTLTARVSSPYVNIGSAAGPDAYGMVQVCEAGRTRAYRGYLVATEGEGRQQTVNYVNSEDHIRGVVPRELAGYIGDLGGGRGLHALRAQAVAARSYALSEHRWAYAGTCDTTSCQVYQGAATISSAGVSGLEDARTTRAVMETAGHVRRHASGAMARTEFSSSTGGWTAGGTFPVVVDDGDAYTGNPNHNWTLTIAEADLAARLGLPDVLSLSVTRRNGVGEWGGRVVELRVETSAGPRVFTGDAVRQALGLKSTWFVVTGLPTPEQRAYVRALYLDFLGRPSDSAGEDHWSTMLSSGALSRFGLAWTFATSEEWLGRLVDSWYLQTLGRPADPAGRAFWVSSLRGGLPVAQAAAAFYASDEYFFAAGGGDLSTWVADLYTKLLGRSADPAGQAYWTDVARTQGRLIVAWAFYQSDEPVGRRVDSLYTTLLGRPADTAGRRYWISVVRAQGDVALAAYLAASDEYFARAQART